MNFFEQQDSARRQTGYLVFLFALAVLCIVGALYLVTVGLIHYAEVSNIDGAAMSFNFWDRNVFFFIAGFTILVIFSGSAYRVSSLSSGGDAIATALGGRPIALSTKNDDERKLLNIVEEMSIASGCRMPRVYLVEDDSINAFAAGFSPQEAVIGVTRGSIRKLSRDELQGVIAHEFSHIFNGDMALNIRLIGILYGITMLSTIGYWTLRLFGRGSTRSSSRSEKGGGAALVVFGLALSLLIIGAVGSFFARLIQAAVSRQREFLADASAVQFTRNPRGIAGAFRRMMDVGTTLESASASEASHMFFGDGVKRLLDGSPWASHPPLRTRIERVMGDSTKAFLGEWKDKKTRPKDSPRDAKASAEKQKARLEGLARDISVVAAVSSAGHDSPDDLLSRVGTLSESSGALAQKILAELPERLRRAGESPLSSAAATYLLLIDQDEKVRVAQTEYLAAELHPGVESELKNLLALQYAIKPHQRLPLLDLVMPALKELSRAQYEDFHRHVRRLVRADQKISLFEYSLERMLERRVGAAFSRRKPPAVQIHNITAVKSEASLLLSALAHMAHLDEQKVKTAYLAGAKRIALTLPMEPLANCTYQRMDEALQKIEKSTAGVKQRLLLAFAAAVMADNTVTVEEAEMLRAFADSLDCPVPIYAAAV